MSAQLAGASASFNYHGASIALSASSPTELLEALRKFGIAANSDKAAAATPTPAPAAKVEAGNVAPSPISAPASVPAAASGSEVGAERPNYEHVKARVLSLAKISREKATEVLAKFGVDHGNKLKLEDYPAFIAAADEVLAAAKVAA